MNTIISSPQYGLYLNKCFNTEIHTLQYNLLSKPKGITPETYKNTQCEINADAIRLIYEDINNFNDTKWEYNPETYETNKLYLIIFDESEHYAIIHNDTYYHSWYNKFTLKKYNMTEKTVKRIIQHKMNFRSWLTEYAVYMRNDFEVIPTYYDVYVLE